jgi:ATP-dependent HslUV protease ATP-binding subunit HslU
MNLLARNLVSGLSRWRTRALSASASALRPDEVVAALDKHIIGQSEAKVATAIALRDQWRRQRLSPDLQREVLPNNILMVGPTGVGKTEVARRLARLADAPFVKVEATKFTEVGVYGTDTDSMITDLVEAAAQQAEEGAREAERPAATERAIERLVKAIGWKDEAERDSIRSLLRDGKMGDVKVEVAFRAPHGPGRGGGGMPFAMGMPKGLADMLRAASSGGGGGGTMKGGVFGIDLAEIPVGGAGPGGRLPADEEAKGKERVSVGEALPQLVEEELDEKISTLDLDAIAIEHAEERGIIFVDEIDKLVRGRDGGGGGGGVSAFSKGEGVQKELLSLIEGTGVRTQRGLCSTAHVLFICAGAFHQAKPSDLLPELQGRLPVRVELKPLTEADFVRILSETRFNLLMQQTKLLETEGVVLSFTEDAVVEIARLAARVNATVENIGARRLRTVVAKLMEKVSFTAPTLQGTSLTIDAEYVKAHTGDMATKVDVGKYIL